MNMIVAFTGKRGHGKDTAAQALTDIGASLLSFADPLREVCATVYGVTMDEMKDPVLKEKPLTRWPFKSPREMLQYMGTAMFRNYLPETWTKAFQRRAASHDFVVLADLRFKNEENCLREMDAILIRVVDPRKQSNDVAAQHVSETEMDGIEVDYTIQNDGSKADLHARVREIVNSEAHINRVCEMVGYVDTLGGTECR